MRLLLAWRVTIRERGDNIALCLLTPFLTSFITDESVIIKYDNAAPGVGSVGGSGASRDDMPLALMIIVPILSFGLILMILTVVCIRRQNLLTSSSTASVTASLVKPTPTHVGANGYHGNGSSVTGGIMNPHHDPFAGYGDHLKRLSSLNHFYAKPWTASPPPPSATGAYVTATSEASPRPRIKMVDSTANLIEDDTETW